MESMKTIYKSSISDLLVKWLVVAIVSGLLLFAFFKKIDLTLTLTWLCICGVSFYYYYQSRCLIFINLVSKQVTIQDGFFPWSDKFWLEPNGVEAIVLSYDTLDKDHDLVPYKPFFVDIVDKDKKTFTVYRTKEQSIGMDKAEELATILRKPLKDWSSVENMTYYTKRVFLVR